MKYGDSTRLKLDRADEHLETLYAEVRTFTDREPYTIVNDRQPDGSWLSFVRLHDEPPLRLGLILGDALHNLHSALDNLIPDVVRASGREPSKRATFPIYDTPRSFEAHIRNRLKAMRPEHVAMLEQLQPYPGRDEPEHAALDVLNIFSNLDKHSAVHATFVTALADPNEVRVFGKPLRADVTFEMEWLNASKPLEDGMPVMRLTIETEPAHYPQLNFHVPFAIAFGESGLRVDALPGLREEIRRIVARFEPILNVPTVMGQA